MKYSLIGIGAVIALWAVIVVLYGAQINVVYLCSTVTEIAENGGDQASSANLQSTAEEKVDAAIFAPTLERLMEAVRDAASDQRQAELRDGLQEIMGSDYRCPALEELVVPSP